MTAPYFVLFDDTEQQRATLLSGYHHSSSIPPNPNGVLNQALAEGWTQGLHAALFLPYEWGLAQHGIANDTPAQIHWFEDSRALTPQAIADFLQSLAPSLGAALIQPKALTSEAKYHQDIALIQAAIRNGEVYQINYTQRLQFTAYGSPAALYLRMRQRQSAPYGVFAHIPAANEWILSFSPELFLNIENGIAHTQPMKGTAPRGSSPEADLAQQQQLQNDPKNRAENIMIVDLLRNDLGKIAEIGGVSVPVCFQVRPYGAVWQMTSSINAKLQASVNPETLLAATFPCGSITGAPKRKSIELIQQLEAQPRAHYTGSIGYLKPDPKSAIGFSGSLNVAIRTLTLTPKANGQYHAEYGVGGGIVIDSKAADEYQECQWKSALLHHLAPEFNLIETLLVKNKSIQALLTHQQRLIASAKTLGFATPAPALWQHLAKAASEHTSPTALRLEYCPDGSYELSTRTLQDIAPYAIIAKQTLAKQDYLRRFKTSLRHTYNQAIAEAQAQNAFDTLFFNDDGNLLEGARSNVFICLNGQWLTPALSLDILNGTARQAIMQQPSRYLPTQTITEALISQEMLMSAEHIYLSNALRGVFSVQLRPI